MSGVGGWSERAQGPNEVATIEATLALAADSLRPSGVEICWAAKGLGPETMGEAYGQVVAWTQSAELTFDVLQVPLTNIESAWQRTDLRGRRLVVVA